MARKSPIRTLIGLRLAALDLDRENTLHEANEFIKSGKYPYQDILETAVSDVKAAIGRLKNETGVDSQTAINLLIEKSGY